MTTKITKTVFIFFLFGALISFGQQSELTQELRERYYSPQIKVGEVSSSLYDSLKRVNKLHPSLFYEICGSFIQRNLMNEAAVAYFVGRNRFKIYNKTNPNYSASGDGALAGSFATVFGEELKDYLNQNLYNYAELIAKSGEWYRDNKYIYFNNSSYDSLYQAQTTALFNLAAEIKNNPIAYINQLEEQRQQLEELINQINLDGIEVDEEMMEEDNDDELVMEKRPTSEIPEAFFNNYHGDHFVLDADNEISAVAHGYYDTYIQSSDAEIFQNKGNPLHYTIRPRKLGDCVIQLFGVTEKGVKVQLASYVVKVIKK